MHGTHPPPVHLHVTLTGHSTADFLRAWDAAQGTLTAGHLNHASCAEPLLTPGAHLIRAQVPPGTPLSWRVQTGRVQTAPGLLSPAMSAEQALEAFATQSAGRWLFRGERYDAGSLLAELANDGLLEDVLANTTPTEVRV